MPTPLWRKIAAIILLLLIGLAGLVLAIDLFLLVGASLLFVGLMRLLRRNR